MNSPTPPVTFILGRGFTVISRVSVYLVSPLISTRTEGITILPASEAVYIHDATGTLYRSAPSIISGLISPNPETSTSSPRPGPLALTLLGKLISSGFLIACS